MRGSEKHLLLAVRNRIRSECGYTEKECAIELDEMAPATVGNVYVAVVPGGCRPGKVQMTSGGVHDLVWNVNAFIVRRIRNVPRDRLRDTFLENLDSLDEEIDKIIEAIDWQYDVINAATTSLEAAGLTPGFIEPLKFIGLDDKPRMANPEIFAGATQQAGSVPCGMVRAMRFGGARRVTYVVRS
jgi:hypothetical protein